MSTPPKGSADPPRSTAPGPRVVTVAASQFACVEDVETNVKTAERIVREAASRGARLILLQELFATRYFPIQQRDYTAHAISIDEDLKYLSRFEQLARELHVVLPVSFYERCNNVFFNSVAVIDADGTLLGIYRKSHIPMSPGYLEKAYFAPGDTGFRTFKTACGILGIGICWDQWFPETARCLSLAGAELLLFPAAIGSEPQDPAMDSCAQWQRAMQGHAAVNLTPVVCSNRIGKESSVVDAANTTVTSITFYGSSFITDHTGAIQADAGRQTEAILLHSFNLDEIRAARSQWGVFRDRRPNLYTNLCSLDGTPLVPATPERRIPLGIPKNENTNTIHGMRAPPGLDALEGVTPEQPRTISPYEHTIGSEVLHDASWIGEVRTSAQRRPRGRCWVCRKKTTFECKSCIPGPVPICSRTARDCWWKYHSGEVAQFVPNRRGRKRSSFEVGGSPAMAPPPKAAKPIAPATTASVEQPVGPAIASPTISSPPMTNPTIGSAVVGPPTMMADT